MLAGSFAVCVCVCVCVFKCYLVLARCVRSKLGTVELSPMVARYSGFIRMYDCAPLCVWVGV